MSARLAAELTCRLTDADDGLNSSALSFEDASRLHSSAIAMETATIQTLRNEKWHLNCKIDELKRQLDAEINEKKALSVKIDGLQTQYESKLRLLRDSTEGDARKDSLRTRELELALHHKEQQLQEAIRLSSEKQSKDTQVLQEKVAHYEKELQEATQGTDVMARGKALTQAWKAGVAQELRAAGEKRLLELPKGAVTFEETTPMLVMPFEQFKAQGRIFKSTKAWREEALEKQWLVVYDESSGKVVIFVSHT